MEKPHAAFSSPSPPQGSIPRKNMSSSGVTIPYYKDDKIRLWDKLREKGYTRCYKSMLRVIRRMNLKVSPDKRKEYKPKPYAKGISGTEDAGRREICSHILCSKWKKYYQYTAVDECARWCFREMYEEHQHRKLAGLHEKLIHCCPFPIKRCRQTTEQNGQKRF